MMHPLLLVGAGGFLGAIARYGVAQLTAKVQRPFLPYGTLFVNLTGAFLLGWITALHRVELGLLLGTGFMGAFTTFSTFKVEGLRMWKDRRFRSLIMYYGVSYTVGAALACAGYRLGTWLG